MSGNKKVPAAAFAGGMVALAVLAGCAREPSMASRSAAAFREAQQRGETFEGAGHGHGHGAVTPGGGHEGHEAPAADASTGPEHEHHAHEAAPPGGGHSGHSTMEPGRAQHATGHAPGHQGGSQGGHAGMDHGPSPAAPAEPDAHAGHDMSPQAPPPGGHAGHSGHSPAPAPTPAAPQPVAPGQPAKTLSPDPLDAPAPTSVADAQRSAEMAGGGHTGHGAHGVARYRHVDAGRGPQAAEAEAHSGHEGHAHEEATVYTCPMHPEVESDAPGKCPKCGMALVERRKE